MAGAKIIPLLTPAKSKESKHSIAGKQFIYVSWNLQ
jgi:hypothetical protein